MKHQHEYRDAWRWPTDVREWFNKRAKGYTLNVCCGQSTIGDVFVDRDPKREGVIRADMSSLPFADNTFDTVASDPPWKLNWFKRQRPFFECVRVCKPKGRVLYNCPWRPTSRDVRLVEKDDRFDAAWGQVSKMYHFEVAQTTLPFAQKSNL